MIDQNIFKNNVPFHGAKGLVFFDDKILVYRRDDKTSNFPMCIDLPGGGREDNESPFETFAREVNEEFGFSISENEITFAKSFQSVVDPDSIAFFLVANPTNVRQKDIVFGSEGIEYFFLTPKEFTERSDGVIGQQKRVLDYLNQT